MTAASLLVIDPADSVAVALVDLAAGTTAATVEGVTATTLREVPRGHKVALRDHAKGEPVIKYGAQIGVSTEAIARGDWVHLHNLATVRGSTHDA